MSILTIILLCAIIIVVYLFILLKKAVEVPGDYPDKWYKLNIDKKLKKKILLRRKNIFIRKRKA